MRKIKSKLTLLLIALFGMVGLRGCTNTSEPPVKQSKDPRKYTFTIDTLVPPEIPQTVMMAMWGTSRNNLYIVGHNAGFGRSMYHFDGQKWSGVGLKLGEGGTVTNIGTLNNIFGFGANDIYAVGDRIYHEPDPPYTATDSSLILHFNGAAWVQMNTPPGRSVQGIWGIQPNDVWAGGIYSTLYHYDGHAWSSVGNFPQNIWFARITGFASNDVYALCYSIPDSANVWHRYYTYHWDGANWTLLDSFVENQDAKFGSQSLQITDGELYSAGLGVYKMLSGTWKRIHYDPSEMGFLTAKGGTSKNIFASGGNGLLMHFNGVDWYKYSQFDGSNLSFNDLWTDNENLFVVADDGWRTYIIHGK